MFKLTKRENVLLMILLLLLNFILPVGFNDGNGGKDFESVTKKWPNLAHYKEMILLKDFNQSSAFINKTEYQCSVIDNLLSLTIAKELDVCEGYSLMEERHQTFTVVEDFATKRTDYECPVIDTTSQCPLNETDAMELEVRDYRRFPPSNEPVCETLAYSAKHDRCSIMEILKPMRALNESSSLNRTEQHRDSLTDQQHGNFTVVEDSSWNLFPLTLGVAVGVGVTFTAVVVVSAGRDVVNLLWHKPTDVDSLD